MIWTEVRRLYPNQFVLMKILQSHTEDNYEVIDDVAVIRSILDPKEATRELVKSKGDTLVYHTSKEEIRIKIRFTPGFRGII